MTATKRLWASVEEVEERGEGKRSGDDSIEPTSEYLLQWQPTLHLGVLFARPNALFLAGLLQYGFHYSRIDDSLAHELEHRELVLLVNEVLPAHQHRQQRRRGLTNDVVNAQI